MKLVGAQGEAVTNPCEVLFLGAAQCHCLPVRLSPAGRSCQFGRANAPMIPQPVRLHARAKGRNSLGFERVDEAQD